MLERRDLHNLSLRPHLRANNPCLCDRDCWKNPCLCDRFDEKETCSITALSQAVILLSLALSQLYHFSITKPMFVEHRAWKHKYSLRETRVHCGIVETN